MERKKVTINSDGKIYIWMRVVNKLIHIMTDRKCLIKGIKLKWSVLDDAILRENDSCCVLFDVAHAVTETRLEKWSLDRNSYLVESICIIIIN